MSDFHVIRSIGVERRGDDIEVTQLGGPPEFIKGVSETVLTIVGEFPEKNIDIVEVNGVRFKREEQPLVGKSVANGGK